MNHCTAARLAALALPLICGAAFAQNAMPAAPASPGNPANFAEHKQKELQKVQSHLQTLQTLQSCVQGANDAAAIKQCNETAHAAMGGHAKKC